MNFVQIKEQQKTPNQINETGFNKKLATTYSSTKTAVPSAQVGLTSLFGKGRGEHHR